jgi:hypothetical protein
MSRTISFSLALIVVAVLPIAALPSNRSAAAEVDPLLQIKPGEWYEVPNSRLDAVAAPESKFPWLRGGIGGIIDCWAGGAFDSQRDRLYIGPGGGHGGYNGNEIYAFDLHDLKWHRLNDPDPVIPGTEYTDVEKAPFAMHTYDAVEYLPPPADRYVVPGGWGTPRTYALDPDHPGHWEVYPDHGTGRTGDLCAYDPVLQLLWLSTPITSGKLSQWDPLTHQWCLRLSDSPEPSYYETADVDYKRRLLVSCGKGKLKTWRLAPIPEAIVATEIHAGGDAEVADAHSPGFCYVPLLDRFVAWAGGADVYTLDMDAKRWTKHPPAPGNHLIPGPPAQWGTFGRFRYVPSMNLFILCNAVNQNVYLYRLTADQPNVIAGVEAKVIRNVVETDIPAAAVSVHAVYADGSRKDVTDRASYFSLDPAVASVQLHGGGVVTGAAAGNARIRAVYADPAFKRGYAGEVTVAVKDILGQSTLDELHTAYPQLTIVAGDSFQLDTTGSYTRGTDHFTRSCAGQPAWSSDRPDVATVSGGLVRAIRKGGPVKVRASLASKSAVTEVNVTDAPVIRRISFRVKAISPRAGWEADNGQPFSDSRGFGWLDAHDLTTRDDRASAHHALLMCFVAAKQKQFKIKVSPGPHVVRIAMGDSDYGAEPFADWVALGDEKLIYYAGHHNTVVTRIVQAAGDGLAFTVNGPINYLIVAPVGTDLAKYADDGPGDMAK